MGDKLFSKLNIGWRNTMADLINELEREQLRDDTPEFAPGDTVRVLYRVREGENPSLCTAALLRIRI